MKCKKISALIKIYTVIVLFALILAASGCKFFTGGATGTAAPHLTVKGATSDIASLSLTISGPGMSPAKCYYTSVPSSITVEVPAGEDRHFELIAHVDPSSPSAATSFKGTATADLKAGETKEIILTMDLNETKLVIPDYQNSRIAQIDNINGENWTLKGGANFSPSLAGNFRPYDIDFDSQGRIYIANNTFWGTGSVMILRIDDMSDDFYDEIVTDVDLSSAISTITIDRVNNYIYYTTGSSPLYRKKLSDPLGSQESFDLLDGSETLSIGNFSTNGISAGQDGFVYLANNMENDIVKYNPDAAAGSRIVAKFSSGINTPWDVMVKSDGIYVTNPGGAAGYKILKISSDFSTLLDNFGISTFSAPPTAVGEFWNARRFIGTLNQGLYFTDDDTNYARIIFMESINGSGWKPYGQNGTGSGEFVLFDPNV